MAAAVVRGNAKIARRLRRRLDELAEVGKQRDRGITRLAYTRDERAAHELFAEWVAADGGRCEVDAAGNTIAIVSDEKPYFLLGSHLDTVRQGGAYDGAAGVIGGLEVSRTLSDAPLRHGLRVVAFAGEEGARFGRPNLGSGAAAGLLEPGATARLRDADGVSLADAAGALELDPAAVIPWLGADVACSFEIHIEQGRQLELGAARIGVVDAIAGSIRLHIEISGRADHSGATPMRARADALAAASEVVLAAERVGLAYRSTTVTVGRLDVTPNSVTTVPGGASLWVDVRDIDPDQQRLAAQRVAEQASEISAARGVTVSTKLISHQRPVVLDAWPRVLVREECDARGLSYRVLSSGAGHDTSLVAARAPAALIFIPCAGGVSHSPAESARVEDLAAAVELATAVIQRADALLR